MNNQELQHWFAFYIFINKICEKNVKLKSPQVKFRTALRFVFLQNFCRYFVFP